MGAPIVEGATLGAGGADLGITPLQDKVHPVVALLHLMHGARRRFGIPTQSCVLAHITTQMEAMRLGAPVDLVFQSMGGTEDTNKSFGVGIALLDEAHQMARELKRGGIGAETGGDATSFTDLVNLMYFETGQGSSLSANAHIGAGGQGIDQQTLEARAYAVARRYRPMLVNTVVGFIGPEYLYDGKQILRAGLEDHFCGKLLGL